MLDDVQHLPANHFPPPFSEAALLLPLYAETEQLGAIIFGRPSNGTQYAQKDIDLILYPGQDTTGQRTIKQRLYYALR